MLTIRRLYLYGVLGASLALLLWGLTDLLRFAADAAADALGTSPAFGSSFAAADLSRAISLLLVAGSIYVVHLVAIRRSLRGDPLTVADERACASRASYFTLVLAGTGLVCVISLIGLIDAFLHGLVRGQPGFDLTTPLTGFAVTGTAWLLHLRARREDLLAAPARTADDWLTRAYLYGAMFVTALLGALGAGDLLTVIARGVLGLRPRWEAADWWQEAIIGSVALVVAMAGAWLVHLAIGHWLRHAPDPLGSAHRRSRARRAMFLAVTLVSTAAVMVLGAMGLQHAVAELFGVWQPTDGSRLIEDVGGPWLMAVPFIPLGWWHLRRVVGEARAVDGPAAARAVSRTGRLLVAFVGLVGLTMGLALELQYLIDAVAGSLRTGLYAASVTLDPGSAAIATALIGLVIWAPAWARSQVERSQDPLEAAGSTSRRAYLVLVSGLALVAAMGSAAYLVWQAIRVVLEGGRIVDASWALAILVVAVVVLGYHLWQLRRDSLTARVSLADLTAAGVSGSVPRVMETIEISAPAGADFRVLNAAIRSELPDGYELRVVSGAG